MKRLGLVGILVVAVAGSAGAQQERPKSEIPDIPASSRPPKGMCRIWLKDVPAAQQPAPTDCAAAVKNCPPNARVIFGDTEETKEKQKDKPAIVPKPFAPTATKKPIEVRKPPIKPPT